MDEGPGDDSGKELTGKRYLVLEISLLMFLLWLPSGWTAIRDGLLLGYAYRPSGDFVARLIHDIGSVGILVFVLWGAGERFGRFGMCRVRARDAGVFGIALMLGFCQHVLVVASWQVWHGSGGPMARPEDAFPWWWWVLTASVTLASAVNQEILMRGYLITRLEDLWDSKWLPFFVSCLLFGIWHIYQGGQGIVSATVAGVIYGLLFLRYRRLWPLAAAHAVVNMLIFTHVVSASAVWLRSFYGGMG